MAIPNYLQFLESIKVFCAFVVLSRLFYESRMFFLQVSAELISTCLSRLCLNVNCVSSSFLTFQSDLDIPLIDRKHTMSAFYLSISFSVFPSVVEIP